MCQIAHVFVFIVIIKVIRQSNATMLASCTSDTDRQMSFLFVIVRLKHEIQIIQSFLDVSLGQLGIQDIFLNRLVVSCLVFQFFHIEWIIQHTYVQYNIRIIRNTVLLSEGFERNRPIVVVGIVQDLIQNGLVLFCR